MTGSESCIDRSTQKPHYPHGRPFSDRGEKPDDQECEQAAPHPPHNKATDQADGRADDLVCADQVEAAGDLEDALRRRTDGREDREAVGDREPHGVRGPVHMRPDHGHQRCRDQHREQPETSLDEGHESDDPKQAAMFASLERRAAIANQPVPAREGDDAAEQCHISVDQDQDAVIVRAQRSCSDDKIAETHNARSGLAAQQQAEVGEDPARAAQGRRRHVHHRLSISAR
jgi:hypothetical protein